ncbi:MAG: VWA domain-containing protein, partial [Desulfuromonadaceae bacterium]|nr:VWA domain-containing protein [Desulfuromonadaceae bacterium]
MAEFHFLRPLWLLIFPVLVLGLVWLQRRGVRPAQIWEQICDPQLLPHILIGEGGRDGDGRRWQRLGKRLGVVATMVAAALFSLALAGPTWEREEQPLFVQDSAVVILLDLSPSMYATDLKPSRLVQARLKIMELLQQRREGQTALVVFAAQPYTVTPLTDDTRTIEAMLGSLDPAIMPVPGSAPHLALEKGVQLLVQAGQTKGTLLLITDEDEPERYLAAAQRVRELGYRLAILGVGTTEGAPVPAPEGGFIKDASGQMVLPKLHVQGLQRLAAAGG